MNANQIHEEIKETNLSYMLLAQQMIRNDKASAVLRLGVSEEMADLVAGLSPQQLLKMAACNMLLCCFHFDERLMLNMITGHKNDQVMPQARTANLLASQTAEVLPA